MRHLTSPLVFVLLLAMAAASGEPVPTDPAPFPQLPSHASEALRAARRDAMGRWAVGAIPQASLDLTCVPVQDSAPDCLRVAAPLGGRVVSTSPSGLVHVIDYGSDSATWAALTHLVDEPSVQQVRIRFE